MPPPPPGPAPLRAPPARRSPSRIASGTWQTVLGAILAILGIGACQSFFTWMPGDLWFAIREAVVPSSAPAWAAVSLPGAGSSTARPAACASSLTMVGNQKTIDIRALAAAFPTSYSRACDDIQDLIDGGYLGKNAYINMATGQLILDSDGFQAPPRPAPEKKAAVDPDQQLLAEIRRANDAIPGAEMSRKIDRIEECTQHILEHLEKHPEKSAELHTFLDYYLPTTLKLLGTYAELGPAGHPGGRTSPPPRPGSSPLWTAWWRGSRPSWTSSLRGHDRHLRRHRRDGEDALPGQLAGSMKIPKPDPVPQAPDLPQELHPPP